MRVKLPDKVERLKSVGSLLLFALTVAEVSIKNKSLCDEKLKNETKS